ncbi:MAG: 3'-5' exonuclease [Planctomycetes bacterium]|nr:3'-5' exonuclease [Planctomycetota bacterium]
MGLPRDFVVFDTETTGAPPGARLVEVGALKVRGRTVVERFEALIFPECPIPPEVVRIHGITDRDVAGAETAAEVLPRFLAWCGERPLVAHNASFDAAMVATECARLGLPTPSNRILCTLRASRRLLQRRSHSLVNLVKDLGLPPAQHHRALDDATHAYHLMLHLLEAAPGEAGEHAFGGGRTLDSYAPDPPRLSGRREVLREAALNNEVLDIHYMLQDQRVIPLRVSPRFFFRRGTSLVMEALCHFDHHYKSYRVDRVVRAHPCPGAPPGSVRRSPGA